MRSCANHSHRATRVEQRRREVIARTEAIADDERRNADRVEPVSDFYAFLFPRQMFVAAAGKDGDGRTRRPGFRRDEGDDRRNVLRGRTESAGRVIVPQRDLGPWIGGRLDAAHELSERQRAVAKGAGDETSDLGGAGDGKSRTR